MVRFETSPESDVYVNGVAIGKTPTEYITDKSELNIKLSPLGTTPHLPYETTLSLTPQTKVIVRRNFFEDIDKSTTQIISLVKYRGKGSPISIITNPGSARIYIDNKYAGSSPLRSDSYEVGIHEVRIEVEGYAETIYEIQTASGYEVVAYTELPRQMETELSLAKDATITTANSSQGYVNVHRDASMLSPQVARVNVGREYLLLESKDDWVKISLNASESGWLLKRYTK